MSENVKQLKKYKYLMKEVYWANVGNWMVHLLGAFDF